MTIRPNSDEDARVFPNEWIRMPNRQHQLETEMFFGTSGTFDDVLLVDVRGGKGRDLERFLGNDPESEGHLILQDLPGKLKNVKTSRVSGLCPIIFSTHRPSKVHMS